MVKIIGLIFSLFLYTSAFAQIGGTQAVEDTMRLPDKFAVYKIAEGQRLDASSSNSDTLYVTAVLDVPEGALPTCNTEAKGNLILNTADSRLYFCNGTAWRIVAYDGDLDGLTQAIDADDTVPFTAGTAGAAQVRSGYTFYTGPGMTQTTGNIATYSGEIDNLTGSDGSFSTQEGYTYVYKQEFNHGYPYIIEISQKWADDRLVIWAPNNFGETNIRNGVTISGIAGTYPSAGNRLDGNTATTDVVSTTMLANNEGFQSDGTLVTGSIPTYGGSISNGGSISSGSYTPANFPFTLQTDDDYVDKDLTINNPTNLSASNVRIGVAIAGNTGTYPSSGNPLNGSDGTTDITAAEVRSGYEGFKSDGTRVIGSIPNNAGGTNTPVVGTGSYTVAGAGAYLTGNVDINRVSATTTISHGGNSGDGPWRSVSCNAAGIGFGVSGPTGGSSGTSIGNGNQITITANEGGQSATYYCGGYSACDSCCPGCPACNSCCAACNSCCGSCIGCTISSPSLSTGSVGYSIPNGYWINVSTCSSYFEAHCNVTCPTCEATGYTISGPNVGANGTELPVNKNIVISANGGSQGSTQYFCSP